MSAPVAPFQNPWFARLVFRWSVGILVAVAAGLVVLHGLHIAVLSPIGLPHEVCYLRDSKLVWLHVISDLGVGVAYVSISATIAYLVYKASRDIPFHWVFLAFGLFIVSCGVTHLMEVLVIWEPLYWLSGYVKMLTAVASVVTAIALFPLVPKIFRLIESARQGERRRLEIMQLNQDLERFNYSVAHDLRAPLRSINGFADVLKEDRGEALGSEGLAHVERIQSSVRRMDRLVSDLLAYATIGRKDLALRPVPMSDVIREVVAAAAADIEARKADVVVSEPLPTVLGDPTLLQVVFQNLIANALKFVAAGARPRVHVAAGLHGDRARICVTDNGVGIPPEARHKIFAIFERLDSKQTGTGIGLALVQRAIERLHGGIGVEGAPAGHGTRFWVELPLAAN